MVARGEQAEYYAGLGTAGLFLRLHTAAAGGRRLQTTRKLWWTTALLSKRGAVAFSSHTTTSARWDAGVPDASTSDAVGTEGRAVCGV